MTNTIIIVGYKLKAPQYNNIRDLQKNMQNVLSERPQHKLPMVGPALLFVNPGHDTINICDFGMYVVFEYFDQTILENFKDGDELRKLCQKKQVLSDKVLETIKALNLTIDGNFGYFSHNFDCNGWFNSYVF